MNFYYHNTLPVTVSAPEVLHLSSGCYFIRCKYEAGSRWINPPAPTWKPAHVGQRPHRTHHTTPYLLVFCFLSRLTLLLTVPYPQLLQQYRPVVECLAVSAAHIATLLEEGSNGMHRGPLATCASRRFDGWVVLRDLAERFGEVGLVEPSL
jgi:hypothetical protein